MEPIGIIASIITIVELLHGGLKTARLMYHAPEELVLLEQEIAGFQEIVKQTSDLPSDVLRTPALYSSLQRSKESIVELNSLIQYEIVSETGHGQKAGRLSWARKKSRVKELRNELALSRANLVAALSSSICLSSFNLQSKVLEISQTLQEVQSSSSSLNENVNLTRATNENGSMHNAVANDRGVQRLEAAFQRQLQQSSVKMETMSHLIHQLRATVEKCEEFKHTEIPRYQDSLSTESAGEALEFLERKMTPNSSPLELSSGFYPEQYVQHGMFQDKMYVVSCFSQWASMDQRLDQYSLLFAQTPRCWRNINVTIQVHRDSRYFAATQLCEVDSPLCVRCRTLPQVLKRPLEQLLFSIGQYNTITPISLKLQDEHSVASPSQKAIDLPKNSVTILDQVADDEVLSVYDWGCPVYLEDEVVSYRQLANWTFCVSVNSVLCIEKKRPFTHPYQTQKTAVDTFVYELKMLLNLQNCKTIVPLVGVVIDTERRHLKSFLVKYSYGGYLYRVLWRAFQESNTVPWSRREKWARQIVECVADVHAKGLTTGAASTFFNLVIDEKDNVVLMMHNVAERSNTQMGDNLPPELQGLRADSRHQASWTTRCDLFRLGLVLWALTFDDWHCVGHLCGIEHCPRVPLGDMALCHEPHSRPLAFKWNELLNVPAYYKHIVTICCSEQPQDRLSASTLLRMFDQNVRSSSSSTLHRYSLENASECGFFVYCDICGNEGGLGEKDFHYHCNICGVGDFDICERCVQNGCWCKDEDHVLTRRLLGDGKMTDISTHALSEGRSVEIPLSDEPVLVPA